MYDELKKSIYKAVKKAYPKADIGIDDIELEKPKNPEHGDIATNVAFKLAKNLKKSPQEIAEEVSGGIEAIPVIGFLNFKFDEKYYQDNLKEIISKGQKYADSNIGKGQKVQVEFLSANPTGPLTLANGRGGFSGDVVANILKKAGYKVEKEYYFNDAGVQIKKVGAVITKIYFDISAKTEKEKKISKAITENIKEQLGVEVEYAGPFYEQLAKEYATEIAKYKSEPKAKDFFGKIDISLPEANKILGKIYYNSIQFGVPKIKKHIKSTIKEKMGIEFDSFFSEYKDLVEENEVEKTINDFKKKNLTYDKDGAIWFKSSKYGDDKDRVLIKEKNDIPTYFANDIAYHWDKFAKRKFDKVVDLWGADHHGYVGRMLAATEAMGFGGKLDIVIFQMVRLIKDGKEYKMSKRKGTYVTMDDLLNELIGTDDAADVARYFFVSKAFDTHMDFDLDLAKDTSEKNPVYYVKYASARINGILRNTKVNYSKPNLALIKEPAEIDLIKKLTELPEIVEQVVTDKKYPVHKFTYYITEVSEKFHKFYHDCRVISDDKELTKSRLALVSATKNILEIVGEDILGIEMPERM